MVAQKKEEEVLAIERPATMADGFNDIGAFLWQRREDRGITRHKMGDLIGVPWYLVRNSEYDRPVYPDLDTLNKMAARLGYEIYVGIRPLRKAKKSRRNRITLRR